MDALAKTARALSIDPRRGARVAGALVAGGLAREADIRRPPAASARELLRFHHADWVAESEDPAALGPVFGRELGAPRAAAVVRAARRAVGGTLAAARAASAGQAAVAFSLGGGFHHAQPEFGSGYCVYHDIGIAIESLRAEGARGPFAVVDLDYHQGEGTLVAFAGDPDVLTWSIHGSVRARVEAIADRGYVLPPGTADADYLALLHRELEPALAEFAPALVFYVAGNDVLAGDKLGDFRLTPAGVFERDRAVTEIAERVGAALVITTGGGYSARAWRSTYAYAAWLLTDETFDFEAADGEREARYERAFRSLTPAELQREPRDWGLSSDDLAADIAGRHRDRRILGFYSAHGVEIALERYGLFDTLRELGLDDFALEADPGPSPHIIRLLGRRPGESSARALLAEIVVQHRSVPTPEEARSVLGDSSSLQIHLLSVEWLRLQDPTRSFSLERPPLVGQEHPGLGCARQVLTMIAHSAERLDLDGAVTRPRYYHVALFGAPAMSFLDPALQGRFLAMRRALDGADYAEATRIVAEDRLRLADGTPLPWQPADFVLATSERLRAWLSSARYTAIRDRERDRLLAAGLTIDGSPSPTRETGAPGDR